MKNALLPPICWIWLSTFLTVAQPIWAAGLSCAQVLSGGQKLQSQSIASFVGKNGLMIESSVFQNHKRSIVLEPVDSWGRGENAKDLFILAVRVESNEQALAFFSNLVAQVNSLHDLNWKVAASDKNFFEIPGILMARVHSPYYSRHLPLTQGRLELEIEIAQSSNEVTVATQIGSALRQSFKIQTFPINLQHLKTYDLLTYEGRMSWGQEAFHEWLGSLSSDARAALDLISGADFRDILPFLRGNRRNGDSSVPTAHLQRMIVELDEAIERGRIPVPVKLYRATADQNSINAWTRLSANENIQIETLSDSAYTFTSLDQDFVLAWNKYQLKGKGIILEIEAPAGLRAGYIDRGPNKKDYAEVILARGQVLTPVRAYTDSTGQKRLVLTTTR